MLRLCLRRKNIPNVLLARYSTRIAPLETLTPFSTLDPARLKSSDHVDLSSRVRFRIGNASKDQSCAYTQYYKRNGIVAPFPPRSTGFFYYHRPRNLPCTASALRFRVVPSLNPATFEEGRDLLRPDGDPWELPLTAIAKTRPSVQQQLLRDRLVTKSELAQCAALFSRKNARPPRTVLHEFAQPFATRFGGVHHLQVVFRDKSFPLDLRVFREQRVSSAPSAVHPYDGQALVRFELSTLPEHAHGRFAVLRILKMIESPTVRIPGYDGWLPVPVEGELVRRRLTGLNQGLKVWARNLASPRGRPLGLLVDAAEPAQKIGT